VGDLPPAFDGKGQYLEPVPTGRQAPGSGDRRRAAGGAPHVDRRSAGGIRAPLVLHDVEGLSTMRSAEALHIKPGTVKSRVHRARLYLRKRLAEVR